MKLQTSHNTIVAIAMAAVVAVGAGTFALRVKHATPVAPTSQTLPLTPGAQDAEVPAPIAPIVPVAPVAPTVPAAPIYDVPAAVNPKIADKQHPAAAIAKKSATIAKSAADPVLPPLSTPTFAAAPAPAMVNPPASDSSITDEVKFQIAASGLSKDADVGVTTALGIVVLTGKQESQQAIDLLRSVAAKVQDVKSVDTTAMQVSGT